MRSQNSFRFLLGAIAALVSAAPGAQAKPAPSQIQLLDKLLASAKPGAKFVKVSDMLLPVAKLRQNRVLLASAAVDGDKSASGGKTAASATSSNARRWPNGDVQYEFDLALLPAQRNAFIAAARIWESVAHLKFVPHAVPGGDYIRVYNDKETDESFSAVGRVGGRQDLSLTTLLTGNTATYDAVHQIGHALGLIDENNRSDRDQFVRINTASIAKDRGGEFAIVSSTRTLSGYDYDSIMHLSRNAFSGDGKDTITVLPPSEDSQKRIGQRRFLSGGDRQGMAALYGFQDRFSPPNNNFASAKPLGGASGRELGTVFKATREANEARQANSLAGTSIWYKFTPSKYGPVTLTTFGSGIDTVMAVYLGLNVATATKVAESDDIFAAPVPPEAQPNYFDLASAVRFEAQAGVTYYIAINSAQDNQYKSGDIGDIVLNYNQDEDLSRYTISGSVKTNATPAAALRDVVINLSGADPINSATTATVKTDAAGAYTLPELLRGNYNVTASKPGFTFAPTSISVALNANATGNDFVATPIPVEQLPEISVSDIAIREGHAGSSFVTFSISMSEPSKFPITVNFATANGTASSSTDFQGIRGQFTFAPGVTQTTVNVGLRPDILVEADETFELRLTGGNGATIIDGTGVCTLVNDDLAPTTTPSGPSS